MGEVPEGRRDVGRDPLPLRFHRPETPRQGRGREAMIGRVITRCSSVAAPSTCEPRRGRAAGVSPARVAVLIASICAAPGSVRLAAQDVGTPAQRESGKKIYTKYCSQCHGEKGDGEGYAASHLHPRPRNFMTGKFKIRTTPNGALPTHQDLVNIIRRGMPYTSMPAWPNLSDQDVSNLAYFVATFSPDFSKADNAAKAVPLPGAPKSTKESVEQGKKL